MNSTELKLKYFPSVSAEEKPCFDISEVLGGGNFAYIGEVFEEANAAFIVKAVNNHERLLSACKAAAKVPLDTQHGADVRKVLDKAIKQAEDL